MQKKPKILMDIKSGKGLNSFSRVEKRLNLSFRSKNRAARIIDKSKPFFVLSVLAVAFHFAGSAFAPLTGDMSVHANTPEEEQRVLREQLQAYETEIAELEAKISDYNKKGTTLKGEINVLNAKISKIDLQIKAVNLSIVKLKDEVEETSEQIKTTEANIADNRIILSDALRKIYHSDGEDLMEILLKSQHLSDFFGNINDLTMVQGSLRTVLEDLVVSRNDLVDQRHSLDLQRLEVEAQKTYQDSQRSLIQKIKTEKNNLLAVTKGQESKFKDLVVEKRKAAAEIRNRIFRLLGGGELRFEEAVKIAKEAERMTGVRAALILSVLTQESAIDGVIGRNLGKCYYNTPRNNASGTVMSNKQKPSFLAIMAEINYDPNITPVSCPIVSDGQYGGAMGPAQFMPTTWWDVGHGTGYKGRVANLTGSTPPNPFNNLDAFTATALYLKDGLGPCSGIYSTAFSKESCASAKYYAGKNWRRFMSPGRYGYRVAERAEDLQKDIDVLDENETVNAASDRS